MTLAFHAAPAQAIEEAAGSETAEAKEEAGKACASNSLGARHVRRFGTHISLYLTVGCWGFKTWLLCQLAAKAHAEVADKETEAHGWVR